MQEIELKLQVPAAQRAAVSAAVAGPAPARPLRLQAAYFDTTGRALAQARFALRLRREGRTWVQTLKGAADDGLTRPEHNVPRGGGAPMPAIEPALHAGTAAGDRLLALLAAAGGGAGAAPLQALYRTDIRRRRRALIVRAPGRPQARVELAFDTGRIEAGAAGIDVCELEIELLAGSPLAVIETARRWLPRHGLWIDLRSKAERGDLLARGETLAPPAAAGGGGDAALRLTRSMSAAQAWQAVLRHCAGPVLRNASQIASGEHASEHVHQLRVGLRRLRSAVALFDVDAEDDDGAPGRAALSEAAATLFRQLGAARDAAVMQGEFAADLRAAMVAAGVADRAPGAAPPEAGADPARSVRATASQFLMLDLLAAAHLAPGAPAGADAGSDPDATTPLRTALAARLNRWHRQVLSDIGRFDELDDESRHRLRKRAKRLRYATEFCASLFGRRRVRRYLEALRALQEQLGAISDVLMAMEVQARAGEGDARAMFARGWLAARRATLIAEAGPVLKAFTKAERFWKRR